MPADLAAYLLTPIHFGLRLSGSPRCVHFSWFTLLFFNIGLNIFIWPLNLLLKCTTTQDADLAAYSPVHLTHNSIGHMMTALTSVLFFPFFLLSARFATVWRHHAWPTYPPHTYSPEPIYICAFNPTPGPLPVMRNGDLNVVFISCRMTASR